MIKQTFKRMVWLICILIALQACKEKSDIIEVVRAMKTITVKEQETEKIFKFSGQVAAVDSSGLSFQTEHPKVPPTGFRTLIFTGIFWRCFVASSPQFVRNRIWCQKPRVPATYPRTHQKVARTDSPRNYSGVPVLSDVPSDV